MAAANTAICQRPSYPNTKATPSTHMAARDTAKNANARNRIERIIAQAARDVS
jgi:RNase P protein component